MEEEKKENMENVDGMPENNGTEQGAVAQTEEGSSATEKLGKFKSVDALLRAYNSLQAEFTRRSQRLKELEREREEGNIPPSAAEPVTPPAAQASGAGGAAAPLAGGAKRTSSLRLLLALSITIPAEKGDIFL